MTDFLSPSEMEFRRRVRDLEAWVLSICQTQGRQASVVLELAESNARLKTENARLRRAVRTLAKLQHERVRRAVMEVIGDV